MGRNRRWTKEELDLLRALAGKLTATEIGQRLNRGRCSVHNMISDLGLTRMQVGSRAAWPAEDVARLCAYVKRGKSLQQTAALLGCAMGRVRWKLRDMGMKISRKPYWSAAEDAQLRAARGVLTARELAVRMGRSESGVRWKARSMGLRLAHQSEAENANRLWSLAQENLLRELAGTLTLPEVAARIGRTHRSIRDKAIKLGLPAFPTRKYAPRGTGGACRKPRAPRVAKQPKQPKQRKERAYVPRLTWCGLCGCPVVNTQEGHARHEAAAALTHKLIARAA